MLSRLGTACDPLATLVYLFLTLVSLRSAGNAGSQSRLRLKPQGSGCLIQHHLGPTLKNTTPFVFLACAQSTHMCLTRPASYLSTTASQ
ncbi:hypothetical protein FOXYSP1_07475 [Fusarium oxysporum f. sp. phaseoli]